MKKIDLLNRIRLMRKNLTLRGSFESNLEDVARKGYNQCLDDLEVIINESEE